MNGGNAKIFGIGYGSTGTRTLVAAAKILGYEMIRRWGGISFNELDVKDGGADNAFDSLNWTRNIQAPDLFIQSGSWNHGWVVVNKPLARSADIT